MGDIQASHRQMSSRLTQATTRMYVASTRIKPVTLFRFLMPLRLFDYPILQKSPLFIEFKQIIHNGSRSRRLAPVVRDGRQVLGLDANPLNNSL